ncbi:MAG: hypothetical protein ACR2NP_13985 [Pirellulaceae bacterium]
MLFRISGLLAAIALMLFTGCVSGPYARQGTAGGALAGGAVGALAGAPSDRALEGAAIGAVAGGVLGGAVGEAADRDAAYAAAEENAYIQEVRSRAVTMDQVVQMTQSGVGDNLIINQIHANGVVGPMTTNDIVAMKQNGVTDSVISAWQHSPVPGAVAPASYVRPVIVHEPPCYEPVYGPGWHYGPPPCHFRRPRYRRAGFHVHF